MRRRRIEDVLAAILAEVSREAYADPASVKAGPQRSTVHRLDPGPLDDPERWALTWRAHRRKAQEER